MVGENFSCTFIVSSVCFFCAKIACQSMYRLTFRFHLRDLTSGNKVHIPAWRRSMMHLDGLTTTNYITRLKYDIIQYADTKYDFWKRL